MKIVIILAILACSNGANDGCKKMKSLYEAFQCKSRCRNRVTNEITKYNCLRSPYVLNYNPETCYFINKTYTMGEAVDGAYLIPGGKYIGSYYCDGGYFDFTLGEPTTDEDQNCLSSALYYQMEFVDHYAPVYIENSQGTSPCPIRWIEGGLPSLNLTFAPCPNKLQCCQFFDENLIIGTVVKFPSQQTTCTCTCPPLMFCQASE
ncbi:hypothetical protein FQR65_LT02080 [Abscondita terminalis]|nr:hypothetical protein FQR65_LT02080 [Abscondita terminalis]